MQDFFATAFSRFDGPTIICDQKCVAAIAKRFFVSRNRLLAGRIFDQKTFPVECACLHSRANLCARAGK
jgi:hypothetical protein